MDAEMLIGTIAVGDGNGKVKGSDVYELDQMEDPGDISATIELLRGRVPPVREGRDKPELDQLVVKGIAEQYADLFASRLESPWSFWAMSFLTVLGAVVCDRVRLQSSLSTQPRLYSVILGESADDRKSEAIKQTVNFFRKFGLLQDLGICYGVGSAEGLAEKLKDQKKVLLIFDEFKTFVSKSSIEAAILLPCVNTLFEDVRFQSVTKTHSINIEGASLSILAASTVDTFTRMFSSIFTDIGFINRLWLTADKAERKFAIPEEIPYEKQQRIANMVNECYVKYQGDVTIPMTGGALKVYEEWYLSDDARGIHGKRLDTYGIRLMLLFALNEGGGEIDEDIAHRVVSLLRWQREVRGEYDPVGCESVVGKIEENIRRMLKTKNYTTRQLRQYSNADKYGLFYFNAAKENLLKAGDIKHDVKKDIWYSPEA